MFYVFAFGSLMFDPEHPDAVQASLPARLEGHRRAFNKASVPRASAPEQMGWPELSVPDFFDRAHPVSLALGTVSGGAMEGRVLAYPDALVERVTASLHAREGVYPTEPRSRWSYAPRQLPVKLGDGRTVEALTYLSNPAGDWHVEEPDPDTTARILLRATPRHRTPRALGVYYLIETWQTLRGVGVQDPHLERLIAAVRQYGGPWQDVLEAR